MKFNDFYLFIFYEFINNHAKSSSKKKQKQIGNKVVHVCKIKRIKNQNVEHNQLAELRKNR